MRTRARVACPIGHGGEPDPGRFGRAAAELLPILTKVGGLDVGEATGFVSGATQLGIDTDQARTGLKNYVQGIRNPKTDSQRATLQAAGVTGQGDLLEEMEKLAQAVADGLVTENQITELVGDDGLAVALSLTDPAAVARFKNTVAAVDRAEDRTDSFAAEKAQGIFAPGSIQAANLFIKQKNAEIESNQAGDTRAVEIAKYRAALDARLTELEQQYIDDPVTGITPADRQRILKEYDFQTGMMISEEGEIIPNPAFNSVPAGPREAMLMAIEEDASNTNLFRLPGWLGGENVGVPGYDMGSSERQQQRAYRERVIVDPVMRDVDRGPLLPGQERPDDVPAPELDPSDSENIPWWKRPAGNRQLRSNAQSAIPTPESVGQVAGLDALSGMMASLIAGVNRTNQLIEQQADGGYYGRQASSVVNNYNGPVHAGDPLVDDLDGRDRFA